ncbi:universal stress protein [Arthrobacter sp. NPDC089319]|uniref:universal stress protein n=1 Tax=Arthrobacter sp. NPDC089319 TaxID=3155915 RepID=UPI00343CD23E
MRRYVVAYTATDSGREAVNLATALARRQGASLDLVMVLPESSPYSAAYPRPESGYDAILSDQIRDWLAEGLNLVPDDVTARAHVRPAESNAEGLIAAAEEFGAALIVIGTGRNSVFRRFSVGTVASGLLHASTVPVALAPRGYRRTEPATRITLGVGNRAGAEDVLHVALDAARLRGLELRLLSLVALDSSDPDAASRAETHVKERLALAESVLAGQVTAHVAQGPSIEDAIDALEWDDGEVMLIGSSRLAPQSRLFLGATAGKVLRALPVPMVVVPRGYRSVPLADDNPGLSDAPVLSNGDGRKEA